ncbi:MbcA/ParS/Xre antitoxin family protein [Mucilaginibacter sp. HMF5004]|uniref:type II RES/Xre toxin-antitoxin system antitoxin n=1 Tax=Mucilaginibacter rivuli TaxID=2857527 RepID=UPI001C5E0743|nr:antitoxin Xre/MbcA/ParS toxin-binding domain-containing protein [Mucilaginibacter rivuli]MBW4890588.1 MbcA/ParS/Xre antitoxin family protein [Mucilaginibacter rivuli]
MSYKEKKSKSNIVAEPMVAYVTSGHGGSSFIGMLGGAASANDWDILKLTRQGLTKRVLLAMAKRISLTLQEFADIMHITERTFQRYDDNDVVRPEYSEKAIELARLYDRGEEVFGSIDKFKIWMRSPSLIFKGDTPLSLLDTSFGFDMVLNELGRIEHGIFA